jgi:hypothetical protein
MPPAERPSWATIGLSGYAGVISDQFVIVESVSSWLAQFIEVLKKSGRVLLYDAGKSPMTNIYKSFHQ